MKRWFRSFKRFLSGERARQPIRHTRLNFEVLEDRSLMSVTVAPAEHVLILSVAGLHQADVADPQLQPDLPNVISLQKSGVTYNNASTTSPSDSSPAPCRT